MTARIVQTISEKTPETVRARLEALGPGIDLVEIRFDALATRFDAAALVTTSPVDIVATARRADQGGTFRGSEAERLSVLRQAAEAGAAFVDLEEGVPWPERHGGSRVIRSFHDFEGVPDDLEKHARSLARDADIVKVACMPHDTVAACRLLELPARVNRPTVAIGMGPHGRFGRIAAGAFSMPLTYAATPETTAAAPGQVPADLMTRLYRAAEIDPSWRLGVVVADSRESTPWIRLIDEALAAEGQQAIVSSVPPGTYAELHSLLALPPVQALLLDGTAPADSLVEANLQEASHRAATRSPLADLARAADLLGRREGGWHAENSWALALQRIIAGRLGPAACHGRQVLVLGSGLRARMAAAAIDSTGATDVTISGDPRRSASAGVSLIISLEEDLVARAPMGPLDRHAEPPPVPCIKTEDLATERLGILWEQLTDRPVTPAVRERLHPKTRQ